MSAPHDDPKWIAARAAVKARVAATLAEHREIGETFVRTGVSAHVLAVEATVDRLRPLLPQGMALHRVGLPDDVSEPSADGMLQQDDLIQFSFPGAVLVPAIAGPVPLTGSGVRRSGRSVCVQGDELPSSLRIPLPYTAPPFTIAGTGVLSLTLTQENIGTVRLGDSFVLLRNTTCPAQFTVTQPAMQPTDHGPVPDVATVKVGSARFTGRG